MQKQGNHQNLALQDCLQIEPFANARIILKELVIFGVLMHLRVGRGVGLGGAAHLPESSDHGKNSHSKHCSSVLANDKPVDTLAPVSALCI